MDTLIQQITERTGISESQARQAVEVVANYLKTQLPAPIASQMDSLLGGAGGQGNQDMANQAQQALGNLGGMLGKK